MNVKKYVLNQEIAFNDHDLFDPNLQIFKRVKKVLDDHVDDILGVDIPLLSKRLKLAGTADVIGGYKQKASIIDIKSAKEPRKVTLAKTYKYFLQLTGYSEMFEECYDFPIKQGVLIFGLESNDPCPVLTLTVTDTEVQRLESLVEQFRDKLDIRP